MHTFSLSLFYNLRISSMSKSNRLIFYNYIINNRALNSIYNIIKINLLMVICIKIKNNKITHTDMENLPKMTQNLILNTKV